MPLSYARRELHTSRFVAFKLALPEFFVATKTFPANFCYRLLLTAADFFQKRIRNSAGPLVARHSARGFGPDPVLVSPNLFPAKPMVPSFRVGDNLASIHQTPLEFRAGLHLAR